MPVSPGALLLPQPLAHLTEFAGGFNGTCGPTADSVAIGAALGIPVDENFMVALTQEMIAHSIADPNGATTIGDLRDIAQLRGCTVAEYTGYAEPFGFDWVTYIRANAGKVPIVIELANGQALHDVETGVGENAVNLHYHYICIVGKQADGYIVADGDNFQVLKDFEVYSLGVLEAATPCALLALAMTRGVPVGIPTGWSDNGTTLTAPGGKAGVEHGFRYYIITHPWTASNIPSSGEYGDGKGGTYQDFTTLRLHWAAGAQAAVEEPLPPPPPPPDPLAELKAQVAGIAADVATLKQEVATLQGEATHAQAVLNAIRGSIN